MSAKQADNLRKQPWVEPKSLPLAIVGLGLLYKKVENRKELKDEMKSLFENWGLSANHRINENAMKNVLLADPLFIQSGYEVKEFLQKNDLKENYDTSKNNLRGNRMGSINPFTSQQKFQIIFNKDDKDLTLINKKLELLLPLMRWEKQFEANKYHTTAIKKYGNNTDYPYDVTKTFVIFVNYELESRHELVLTPDEKWHIVHVQQYRNEVVKNGELQELLKYAQKNLYFHERNEDDKLDQQRDWNWTGNGHDY